MFIPNLRVHLYNCDRFRDVFESLPEPDGREVSFEAKPHVTVEGTIQFCGPLSSNLEIIDRGGRALLKSSQNINVKHGKVYADFELEKRLPEATQAVLSMNFDDKSVKERVRLVSHQLFGRITDFDGDPIKGYVVVNTGFVQNGRSVATAKSDKDGYYEISLPQRRYHSIFACDENYGRSKLESWAWNIFIDKDAKLDFRIGEIELYRMTSGVSPERTVIADFVPMSIHCTVKRIMEDYAKGMRKPELGSGSRYYPSLDKQDLEVFVDSTKAKVLTLNQRFQSLGDYDMSDYSRPAWTIEAKLPQNITSGTHILRIVLHKKHVEKRKVTRENGEATYHNLDVW